MVINFISYRFRGSFFYYLCDIIHYLMKMNVILIVVGSVVVRQTAGVMSDTEIISQNVPEKRGYDELYGELEKKRHSNSWKLPSDYTALDAVYKVAKEQNADGIINLKITMPEVNNADIIELSGMLIKRK